MNLKDLEYKLRNGEEISISFKYPTDNIIVTLNSLIARTLSGIDRIFILDSLITILRELIVNAVKANCKRLYFQKENLDINIPGDYETGMEKFMFRVMKNLDHFQGDLENSGYTITITICSSGDGISLSVINNINLLPIELDRINVRRKKAIEYDNFSEAYAEFYDPSEGAGLGIILIVFLLRNAGIDADSFRISQGRGSVQTSIYIPYNSRKDQIINSIKEKLIDQVNSLPSLPENILGLQDLCRKEDASIKDIVSLILMDPSLTAEILRVANTAVYYTGNKTDDIYEAVMRIGLKTLGTLLMVFGSKEILSTRHKHFKQIWSHSNTVALYGKFMALDLGFRSIADKIYMAGLLHDMGKIVLLSADAHVLEQISEIIKNREIRTSTIIEEISIGISHSTIGALIAEKWNFPEYIVEAIRYHHSPLNSGRDYTEICRIVYLANMFAGILDKRYNQLFIETSIFEQVIPDGTESVGAYLEILKKNFPRHIKS